MDDLDGCDMIYLNYGSQLIENYTHFFVTRHKVLKRWNKAQLFDIIFVEFHVMMNYC